MKVLNIGSLNYDYVYHVDHIILPGETMDSSKREIFYGGKGFNQSVSLAKAGLPVYHAGMLGTDSADFIKVCRSYGVHTDYIKTCDINSGHAIIQIDKNGQNSILLFGGSNRELSTDYIDGVLHDFKKGDYLILQNEVNLLSYMIDQAYTLGMNIVLNPSPYNEVIEACDLSKVTYLLLNEVEGCQITKENEPDAILSALSKRLPATKILLTLGAKGCLYFDGENRYEQPVFPVDVVDTTAAGDTFTGYFIASLIQNKNVSDALKTASKASSIAVSKKGAAPSIPALEEVLASLSV